MDSIVGNGTFSKSLATIFLAIPSEIVRLRNEFAKFRVAHNIRRAMFHACKIEFYAIDSSCGGAICQNLSHTEFVEQHEHRERYLLFIGGKLVRKWAKFWIKYRTMLFNGKKTTLLHTSTIEFNWALCVRWKSFVKIQEFYPRVRNKIGTCDLKKMSFSTSDCRFSFAEQIACENVHLTNSSMMNWPRTRPKKSSSKLTISHSNI